MLLIFLLVALPFLILSFIELTTSAFRTIGFSRWHSLLIILGSFLGSMINIPIPFVDIDSVDIAVNVGGCIIPVIVSLDLMIRGRTEILGAIGGVIIVSFLVYLLAEPVPGVGITLPIYIPPLISGACGLILACSRYHAPSIAYISGTLGTFTGADILHLAWGNIVEELTLGYQYEPPSLLSIGGAGVFDGIFLTGILAVLLASLAARFLLPKQDRS